MAHFSPSNNNQLLEHASLSGFFPSWVHQFTRKMTAFRFSFPKLQEALNKKRKIVLARAKTKVNIGKKTLGLCFFSSLEVTGFMRAGMGWFEMNGEQYEW